MVESKRFTIWAGIPEKTKQYFLPMSDWTTTYRDVHALPFIPVDFLSLVRNGFSTKPFPYSNSQIYVPPFFIIFKSNHSLTPNFLEFRHFYNPNLDRSVLAMLTYNADNDAFVSKFSLGVKLPYSNTMTLSNVLEFIIVDSKYNLIEIEDMSQLYIALELID